MRYSYLHTNHLSLTLNPGSNSDRMWIKGTSYWGRVPGGQFVRYANRTEGTVRAVRFEPREILRTEGTVPPVRRKPDRRTVPLSGEERCIWLLRVIL